MIVSEENVSVDPLMTGTLDVRAADSWKFPAVEASQNEMWVMVSLAVMENAASADRDIDVPDGALKVAAFRVTTALTFAVPAAPGSPMWSFTYGVIPVWLVPR